jgi:hypothetical protein
MTVEWEQTYCDCNQTQWHIDLGYSINLTITRWKDRGYVVCLNDCSIRDFVGTLDEAKTIADEALWNEVQEISTSLLKAQKYLAQPSQPIRVASRSKHNWRIENENHYQGS